MNEATLLLRQAHSNFVVEGQLTSQVFTPNSSDGNQLSVYDGDNISPADSHAHYTETLGLDSCGVWGLMGAEISAAALTYRPDPLAASPHHSVVDFGDLDAKAVRKKAKFLKENALRRGLLFPK